MVHTHQNGSGADQTHDDTGKDGRDTEQHIQHPCQTFTDVNAHGTNDRQGKEAGNEQGDGGGDNGAGGFGNDIIDPLVDIAQSKYAEMMGMTEPE